MTRRILRSITFLPLAFLLVGCQVSDAVQPDTSMQKEVTVPVIQETPAESPTEEPSEPWRIIKQVKFEHEPTYAAFMSELFGVSNCGQFTYQPSTTTDGGKSWILFDFVNHVCLNAFDIVDVQSIWLCNEYSVFSARTAVKVRSTENFRLAKDASC